MSTTKPQRFSRGNGNHSFHLKEETVDGYISIASDASVVASSFSAVSSQVGRSEPDTGTSWCSAGTIAKNGTGVYEVTLSYDYVRLLEVNPIFCHNSSSATVAFDVRGGADNVRLSTTPGTQKLVFVIVNSSTGAPANPNVACGIRFSARLKK